MPNSPRHDPDPRHDPSQSRNPDPRLDPDALLARLPAARGRITPMQPLDALTWLRVGGPAEVLFQPEDMADLRAFLAACDKTSAVRVEQP